MDQITRTDAFNPSVGFAETAQLRSAMAQPVVAMLNAQAGMLAALNDAAANWVTRRREEAEAARDTVEKLAGCRDANEFMSLYGEWMRGTMQRLSDDLGMLGEQAQALYAGSVANTRQVEEAGERAAEQAPHAVAA
jgi:hypothetical protein